MCATSYMLHISLTTHGVHTCSSICVYLHRTQGRRRRSLTPTHVVIRILRLLTRVSSILRGAIGCIRICMAFQGQGSCLLLLLDLFDDRFLVHQLGKLLLFVYQFKVNLCILITIVDFLKNLVNCHLKSEGPQETSDS